jgi:carboxyl-terminal processing protease
MKIKAALMFLVFVCCITFLPYAHAERSQEQKAFFDAYAAIKLRYLYSDKIIGFEKWFDEIGKIQTASQLDSKISEMISGLNDPYTHYEPPATQETDSLDKGEKRISLGIALAHDNNIHRISYLQSGTEAYNLLRPGDIVTAIADQNLNLLSAKEINKLLFGKPGQTIKVVYKNDGMTNTVTLTFKKPSLAKSELPSSKLLDHEIAYIRIPSFGDLFHTNEFMDEFIKCELEAHKSKHLITGLILDLRGNLGGSREEAVALVSLFLTKGIICHHESRFFTGTDNYSLSVVDESPKSKDIPSWWQDYAVTISKLRKISLIVLVDGSSASASEIVAGALQDHKRAKLIGVATWGKGFGQADEVLANGGRLYYTQHKWSTPNNFSPVPGNGIKPDIVIEQKRDLSQSDLQLNAALTFLKKGT